MNVQGKKFRIEKNALWRAVSDAHEFLCQVRPLFLWFDHGK